MYYALKHYDEFINKKRNDVYEMEKELNDRVKELDQTLRTTREDLENKVEEILSNPLNVVE